MLTDLASKYQSPSRPRASTKRLCSGPGSKFCRKSSLAVYLPPLQRFFFSSPCRSTHTRHLSCHWSIWGASITRPPNASNRRHDSRTTKRDWTWEPITSPQTSISVACRAVSEILALILRPACPTERGWNSWDGAAPRFNFSVGGTPVQRAYWNKQCWGSFRKRFAR